VITAGLIPLWPLVLAWFYMPVSRWKFVDTGLELRRERRALKKELETV
jgi:hypothetical protein